MKIQLTPTKAIGGNEKPFIIAEIGSNWLTFEDAKNSIPLAKNCGADAVKFQVYDSKSLYGLKLTDPDMKDLEAKLREMGREPSALTYHAEGKAHFTDGTTADIEVVERESLPGVMPLEWLPKLKEKADACGIEFMCSAFSPELYDAVNPFVNIHKVASSELSHKRILERLRSYGKPVILSCGAATERDIGHAIDLLGDTPTILMYCVGAYPARFVDPSLVGVLAQKFNKMAGYSDHTTDVMVIPGIAKMCGAKVIEKHVTFIDAETPDSPHSLKLDEFKIMCKVLTEGLDTQLGPTYEEQDMVLKHRRRLIATKDINPGEIFQEGINFGIYRSLQPEVKALSGFAVDSVNGKTCKTSLKAGEGIGPFDIES